MIEKSIGMFGASVGSLRSTISSPQDARGVFVALSAVGRAIVERGPRGRVGGTEISPVINLYRRWQVAAGGKVIGGCRRVAVPCR